MTIDFHVHSFPPEVVADRERFFDGEPAFRDLYGHPKARLVDTPALLEAMDQNGVDGAVIFGFPWKNRETARRHNDYVLESAAKNSRRLIPLACFDPLSDWAVNEAFRCLEAGVAGLGELAVYEACDVVPFLWTFDACACQRTRWASVSGKGAFWLTILLPAGFHVPGRASHSGPLGRRPLFLRTAQKGSVGDTGPCLL